LGYVTDDEVAVLLRNAACVAYPSSAEGFGLPALEVLASGAPLVTSGDTVMADLAGDAAVLVPIGDRIALAEALVAVTIDHDGVDARRRRGFEVASRYTWEACADAHLALWKRTAEKSPPLS
jgi:glycosyltransferase involved in cell wall biosynthesis